MDDKIRICGTGWAYCDGDCANCTDSHFIYTAETIETMTVEKAKMERRCDVCKHYSALAEPRKRSDGSMIYGYCFQDGDKDYSLNMGKGYPVFIDGAACKAFVRKMRAEK